MLLLGVTLFQTLLMLTDYKKTLESINGLKPQWIGLTSLFTESEVDA